MAALKPAGQWTYEDLFDLPNDGKRYEIIHGELYELPAPTWDHAHMIMNIILSALGPLVRALGGEIATAPVDVFLPDANPVQPDILVLMPKHLHFISKRGVEGPPDLVVEVISPSDPQHDRAVKRSLYAHGGVSEYWLVSPEAGIIEVLTLQDEDYRTHVRAGDDELVTSPLLPDVGFPASAVFE